MDAWEEKEALLQRLTNERFMPTSQPRPVNVSRMDTPEQQEQRRMILDQAVASFEEPGRHLKVVGE